MSSEAFDVGRSARDAVRRDFQWVDGEADVWTMFRRPDSLHVIVRALAEQLRSRGVDVVVGIESRGFVLAPAVALELGVGFSPIRKNGALFPGPTASVRTEADYRGHRHALMGRTDHFEHGAQVALVDDWIETGSQARTVQAFLETCGARLVAIAVVIDEASREARTRLPPITSILPADDLPCAPQ